ncbi:hypothetical protein [Kitasatospora sp. NPDC057015]|uniref:hypothetical protein n=1 Tax=Kitasatospora sp. NPDC057015 TaxID=3346001 RepID=UPI003643D7DF
MTTSAPVPEVETRFSAARQIADAVLFEGYVLYPYRASAAKNRLRWQFGVLVPPAWGADSAEHSSQRTECLMEPRRGASLLIEVRFLRAQRRTVERALPGWAFEPTDALELPDRILVPWDEGVEERIELTLSLDELTGEGVSVPFSRPASEDSELVHTEEGQVTGRLLRRREQVDGLLRLRTTEVPGPYAALKLTAELANAGGWAPQAAAARDAALPHSLISAHLLLGLTAGTFVSMTDPPEWARGAVADCRNERTWPVLAGEQGRADVLLSSPIILEDHPMVAPESAGTLYDATEIDEILALRTTALTDREKREARGTDIRAGEVIDLADSLPPEVWERLHGAVRALREITDPAVRQDPGAAPEAGEPFAPRPETPWWDPAGDRSVDPSRDRVRIGDHSVGAGSRVLLKPGLRRTDAQDLFLDGRSALVEAVLHDVDGAVHLAVTVEGDPGADLWRQQGRFLYFQPDEVVPLEEV